MRDVRAGSVRLFSPISEKAAESIPSSIGFGASSSSKPERTGRDGFLDLAFRRDGQRTILARRRFTHPLQALAPIRAPDGSLCLMMLNPSGGMVGGDRLTTTIELGPQTSAVLTTASATKAYRTIRDPALQNTLVNLGDGAILEYLPDHLIPHPGAAVRQSLRVEMAPQSRAILYDAIAAGRIGRDERWAFRELSSEVVIYRNSLPIYLNRSQIIPEVQPLTQLGWMEDFNYLASIIVVGEVGPQWSSVLSCIETALDAIPGINFGASEIACGGWVVRFMTRTATDLTIAKQCIWAIARRSLLGLEAFDLRK
jgi:urease accessory protein